MVGRLQRLALGWDARGAFVMFEHILCLQISICL